MSDMACLASCNPPNLTNLPEMVVKAKFEFAATWVAAGPSRALRHPKSQCPKAFQSSAPGVQKLASPVERKRMAASTGDAL